jgi:hypothetical protein
MSENIHPQTELLKRLDRLAKVQMLGIRDLYKPGHHPRHRPATVDAELKRYEIAQMVAVVRAVHPDWQEKEIRYRVCKYFGVKRAYYYRVLKEIEPERWCILQASAAAIAEQVAAAT